MGNFKAPLRPDAIVMDDLPWKPGTKKYRLAAAIREARLPEREFRVLAVVLWRRPPDVGMLSGWCAKTTFRQARMALKHLEQHGWVRPLRGGDRFAVEFGEDCGCPAPVKRERRNGVVIARSGFTALYRLFDATDKLLYVGISDRTPTRLKEHEALQRWWPDVAYGTVAWYETRDRADLAETLAIAIEKPLHNVAKVYAPRRAERFEIESGPYAMTEAC